MSYIQFFTRFLMMQVIYSINIDEKHVSKSPIQGFNAANIQKYTY